MIHPTAIIEPGAKLGNNVSVGPYSYIGNDVEIGDNCIIESHVVVKGPSTIGSGNHIFQFASVGEACQDKKYANEPTTLIIGDNNVIRECATIHRGTIQDQGVTKIGSNNLFMMPLLAITLFLLIMHLLQAMYTLVIGLFLLVTRVFINFVKWVHMHLLACIQALTKMFHRLLQRLVPQQDPLLSIQKA